MSNNDHPNFAGWTCPAPLRNYPTIVMGHGSGGKMMSDLIQHLFVPAFADEALDSLGDAAALSLNGAERVAFSTDSFVVSPLFFPGGNIGELAVNGTVNDLVMAGAQPLFLSAGFILEEGLPMEILGLIVEAMAEAARAAGVRLVTGDTKVVERGHGDGLYINTAGLGLIPAGLNIEPRNAQAGDIVIVSGTLGDHGIAIMSKREGLTFETEIVSDSAPLNGLVADMLAASPSAVHVLRDATRGGLSAVLNELAVSSGVGIEIEETRVPVKPSVQAACEMLGLDPYYIANEGKLVAIVAAEAADVVLAAMQTHLYGKDAAIIGRVVTDNPGMVSSRTIIGGMRILDMPVGELLPRIC